MTYGATELTPDQFQERYQKLREINRLEVEKDKISLLSQIDTAKRIMKAEFENLGTSDMAEIQSAISRWEKELSYAEKILKAYEQER